MAHDEPVASGAPTKLAIKNVGLMLSGDLGKPILDADAIVAVDGRIMAIGRAADLDLSGATTTIDAHGVALAPGLIDSHVHPVAGDWTPRQNQSGWIDTPRQARASRGCGGARRLRRSRPASGKPDRLATRLVG
jgi:enamidase